MANSFASAACGLIVVSMKSKTSWIFESSKSFVLCVVSANFIDFILFLCSDKSFSMLLLVSISLVKSSFFNSDNKFIFSSSIKISFSFALPSNAFIAEIGTTFAKYLPNLSFT